MLSVLKSLFLLHRVFIGDWVSRVITQLDFTVSTLTTIQEYSSRAKDNSIVRLELNRVSARQFLSIDITMRCCFCIMRYKMCPIALGLERSMLVLDSDTS